MQADEVGVEKRASAVSDAMKRVSSNLDTTEALISTLETSTMYARLVRDSAPEQALAVVKEGGASGLTDDILYLAQRVNGQNDRLRTIIDTLEL